MTTYQSHKREGTFLMGWGGVLAVLLGIGIAVVSSPLIREIVELLVSGLQALGTSEVTAITTLYFLQAIAIGIGVAIAVAGSDARMDRLRGGTGDWTELVRETLVVTGVVMLWVMASATWDLYVDTYNTYGNEIELPMIAILVAFIAGSIIFRFARKHRRSRPS